MTPGRLRGVESRIRAGYRYKVDAPRIIRSAFLSGNQEIATEYDLAKFILSQKNPAN